MLKDIPAAERLCLRSWANVRIFLRHIFNAVSQWDGDYEPVVKSRTPIYFVIGEGDEYYGPNRQRKLMRRLYNMYRDQGLTDQEIDELLVLDIKDADYFESRGCDSPAWRRRTVCAGFRDYGAGCLTKDNFGLTRINI